MPDSFAEQMETVSEHQQAADQLAAKVLARAQAGGVTVSSEIRREALTLIRKLVASSKSPREILFEFLSKFRAILQKYEPHLARVLADGTIAGFFEGGQGVLRDIKKGQDKTDPLAEYLDRLRKDSILPPEPPDWTSYFALPGEPAPIVRYPIIEAAAHDMAANGILTPATMEAANQIARMEGFTAGRSAALDAMERVRDALVEAVVDGDSLQTFRGKVGDALDASGLSPSRQEMLFRNVVMRSYARGQKVVVEHPAVRSVAVFAWRAEIDDSRLTKLCRTLSNSGLVGKNGKRTSVFWVQDPVWRIVAPQSHPGCRCGVIYMPVKRAAEKGILVAQKWLATGIQPSDEELCVPMPDLSLLPERDRLAFELWESPWQAA